MQFSFMTNGALKSFTPLFPIRHRHPVDYDPAGMIMPILHDDDAGIVYRNCDE